MALRIRRGLDSQRTQITFENGEPIWVTDTGKLYIGDGITQGAKSIIEQYAGPGLTYNPLTEELEVSFSSINSDDVTEGNNHLFFTSLRAQNAAAALFTSGTHTNISYTYDDVTHKINSSVTISSEIIQDLVSTLFTGGIHSGITFVYDDNNDRINASVTVNPEDVQDTVAELFTAGVHTGITATYQDLNNRIDLALDYEPIQDNIAALFTTGYQTGITVEYQDQYNRINLTVDQNYINDTIGSLITSGTHFGITPTYNSTTNFLSFTVSTDYIEDTTSSMLLNGVHTGLDVSYHDDVSTFDISVNDDYITDLIGVFLTGVTGDVNVSYNTGTNAISIDLDLESVQDIVATMFNGTFTGITATYDDLNGKITLESTVLVSDDPAPSLGGNLTLNSYDIVGNGNIDIFGGISAFGDVQSGSLVSYSGTVSSPDTTLKLVSSHTSIYALTDGTTTNPGWAEISSYKGTYETPTALAGGDVASSLLFKSYFSNDYYLNAAFNVTLDAGATLNTTGIHGVPSTVELYVKSSNAGGNVRYDFDSKGTFSAPTIQTGTYTNAADRDAKITSPAYGMIVYVADTSKFTGYVADTGGGSPGWVNLN